MRLSATFLKRPPALASGQEPGRSVAGKVTEAQVRIAEQKMGDMNAVDVDGAMAMTGQPRHGEVVEG